MEGADGRGDAGGGERVKGVRVGGGGVACVGGCNGRVAGHIPFVCSN